MTLKLRKDYELVPLLGEYCAIPVGEAGRDFRGMIRFNETGLQMWNAIRDGADTREKILQKMRDTYEELDEETVREDLDRFLDTIQVALDA